VEDPGGVRKTQEVGGGPRTSGPGGGWRTQEVGRWMIQEMSGDPRGGMKNQEVGGGPRRWVEDPRWVGIQDPGDGLRPMRLVRTQEVGGGSGAWVEEPGGRWCSQEVGGGRKRLHPQ